MRPILRAPFNGLAILATRWWSVTRLVRRMPHGVRGRIYRRLMARELPRDEVTASSLGTTMRLDLRDDVQRSIYFGLFEVEELELLRNYVQPGDLVIDVGANVGFYTCHVARWVGPGGRVYAFEPEPRNVERLRANVALNGLEDRVSVRPVALSYEEGQAQFNRAPGEHSGWGSLNRYGEHVDHIVVNTQTVDSVVEAEGLEEIALLKVDVEGADFDVYRGAEKTLARKGFRHIMSEWNGVWFPEQGWTFERFIDHFRAFGYQPVSPLREMVSEYIGGSKDADGEIVNVVFERG